MLGKRARQVNSLPCVLQPKECLGNVQVGGYDLSDFCGDSTFLCSGIMQQIQNKVVSYNDINNNKILLKLIMSIQELIIHLSYC